MIVPLPVPDAKRGWHKCQTYFIQPMPDALKTQAVSSQNEEAASTQLG
jgi:hypothetical protein